MILADEYEELEKEREAHEQENKFSRTKSAEDAKNQATWINEEMTNAHHHTKEEVHGNHPNSNRYCQTIPCEGRQAPHRGHRTQAILQTLEPGALPKLWWERTL